MKNSAKRARAEAWTTKTKHSRGKTLQGNNKEILGNIIGGVNNITFSVMAMSGPGSVYGSFASVADPGCLSRIPDPDF
jgi:hypothetical protein